MAVTKKQAREAFAATGLIVDNFDGTEAPSMMDLFMACEVSDVTPPPELLAFIPDEVLKAFGYEW